MHESHILKNYDAELARLGQELEAMGAAAAAQLEAALRALEQRDDAAAERVIAADAGIDARESELSHDVLRLLALRQPVARDLREVLAALRIASDIERVGDLAANLAKRCRVLNTQPAVPAAAGLRPMADFAIRQLRDVLRAYVQRDVALAIAVRERDAELDRLHTELFRALLAWMAEDSSHIGGGTHLLFIAKNIERIGDHATNIAENVWFIEHGETPLEAREKRDASSSLGD
ncbi:phosphate signaling complex protein PhoU [uncultured Aquimonas sp.]|jgi:phosphate transport system protein|uniref:phosphate signaling complex protein PhoU n=1 Tax=uncultured Aquimonas sp. TaxID=385483 RepID=UPI00086BD642|nr:phosphate signaling complex protein PhoU [uncultured Aquimonas sp.]ODU45241.1 MAG: phosphate transport system regulatory protein PhoU [Xanthomonadaceae bacterium SCN 69-123]